MLSSKEEKENKLKEEQISKNEQPTDNHKEKTSKEPTKSDATSTTKQELHENKDEDTKQNDDIDTMDETTNENEADSSNKNDKQQLAKLSDATSTTKQNDEKTPTKQELQDNNDENYKQQQLAKLSDAFIIPNDDSKEEKDNEEKEEKKIDDIDTDEKKEDLIQIKSIAMEDRKAYYFLNPTGLNPEYDRDVVSILALSDTLSTHTMDMMQDIPSVDILIHAGNFTLDGTLKQVQEFNEWINLLLKTKQCKYALIIAGNHEINFDKQYYQSLQHHNEIATVEGVPDNINNEEEEEANNEYEGGTGTQLDDSNDLEVDMVKKCRHSIKNAIYLEDQGIEILGLKFYGTPWSIHHNDDNDDLNGNYRAFSVESEAEMKKLCANIPYDVDVMISHYPPYLHGDGEYNVGSKALIEKLYMDIQPNVHVFGHVTSCHGVTTQANMETAFMNVNCSNEESEMQKKPILFYLQPKLESFF